jgi:hypothetical protein
MSQEEVYNWLKRHNTKWYSVSEISNKLTSINRQSITVNCYKLRKFGFVKCRKRKVSTGQRHELEYKRIPSMKI